VIRLSVQSRLVPGESLRERHDAARRFGFDGLELSGFPMIELAEEALRDRVPVSAMCSGHRGWFIDPDPQQIAYAIADMKRLVELGAELDAPLIVIPIYGRTANLPPHCGTGRSAAEDEALFLEGIGEVAKHAEKVGGRMVLEAINRFENSVCVKVADSIRFVRLIGSPAVDVMGDVFHMNIEEADMGASLEAAGKRLGYVHLADSQRLEPGKGHLDFDSVFRALSRIGYDGFASIECHLSGPAEEVLPPAVDFLRRRIAAAANGSAQAAAAASARA
jgi:sugar phosphate isomerase/epimerase